MHRRRFVAATAAAGLAGLAGCSSASGSLAPPEIPESLLEEGGWKQQSKRQATIFERSFVGVEVSADAYTRLFEDVGLRQEIAEKTLGQVTGQFSLFSATRVNFDPNIDNLPAGIGQDRLLDETEKSASDQFAAEMRNAGLENVQQTDSGTIDVDTGEEARLLSFTAEYPFDTITFPVTEDRTITVEGDAVAVDGDLAVWHHGDFVLVAGGAYPGENFARSIQKELSSAITVSVDLDLGLTPDVYREEVRGLIRATS